MSKFSKELDAQETGEAGEVEAYTDSDGASSDDAPSDWVALPTPRQPIFSTHVFAQKKLRTWELVLHSQGIPYRLHRRGKSQQLMVPGEDVARALEEITSYERENRNWPPALPASEPITNVYPTLFGLLILALFHALTQLDVGGFGHAPIEWFELGAAHSYKIRAGEWWRIVTALTLHSSDQHLLGNVVIGGMFILFVCSELGVGLGWSSILASGILGNLANALTRKALHLSVGASTSSFGAVGILVGLRLCDDSHRSWRRWLLPLAGGVGLMAMLGTGGQRTDLGAHYLGLAAGLGLGVAIGLWKRNGNSVSRKTSRTLTALTLVIPAASWLAALILSR